MPEPIARAHSIAAALATSGLEPRVIRQRDSLRVEVDAPESLSRSGWSAVLAALRRGDDFGHEATAQGAVLWSLVRAEPSLPDSDLGEGHPEEGSNGTH
ncbi:hypothetical protein DVA86_27870 [Streptomyces armeniacus]|uniref:Uncharacterized protein n=1 Tax=Streptomyces armeniacus TaxID=83291 RepID=A0A345XW59_9ACTN|nr:hypothetical protein [Streptomyces armeniacus]AXK35875.1 hypothetical protein DVA86_27870 [Streptomyces armeniacus]